MFGKPHWFREKTIGWGLAPVTWQGWVYTLIWTAVMILPFLLLLATRREVEAGIWLAASMGMLLWDVREIIKAMRHEVLFIDEKGAARVERKA